MGFDRKTTEDVLVSCGRHCVLCHTFCGTKIELHHIVQKADGGADTIDNCIPLCFDCHAEVKAYNPKHPKGRMYTQEELKRHRDSWFEKVKKSGFGLISDSEYAELDKDVYKKIKSALNENDAISFIRVNNFAGFSFDRRLIDPFHKFESLCDNNPEFEFIDEDLETLRADLEKYIKKFTSLIATQTFPTHAKNMNTVPPEWEDGQPEYFEKVVNSIHDCTTQITNTYDKLIKIARRKLGRIE